MLTMMLMESPIGALRLVASETHLVGVFLPVQELPPEIGLGLDRDDGRASRSPILDAASEQLAEYFAGTRTSFDLPLAPIGTDYQRSVWRALERIPFGETRSYGALAATLGSHSRAVGSANGKNPISIIVPCHRVIASSGDLTGYAGGLDAKRWLLDHEQRTVRACRPGTSSGSSAQGSPSSPAADS